MFVFIYETSVKLKGKAFEKEGNHFPLEETKLLNAISWQNNELFGP